MLSSRKYHRAVALFGLFAPLLLASYVLLGDRHRLSGAAGFVSRWPPTNDGKEEKGGVRKRSGVGSEVENSVAARPRPPTKPRYITASITDECGNFANLLWRFVSLYAVGRRCARIPYFTHPCYRDFKEELAETLPNLWAQILVVDPVPRDEHLVAEFPDRYATADNYKRLQVEGLNATYMRLVNANFMQDPGFLKTGADGDDAVDTQLWAMLRCAPTLMERLDQEWYSGGGGAESADNAHHKLCVHTRQGTMIHYHSQSWANFTTAGVSWMLSALKARGFPNVSLVLMGDDRHFLEKELDFSTEVPDRHLLPPHWSRAEDFCFAVGRCDSLLVTAGASSFAWWIAKLMTVERNISRGNDGGGGGLIAYNADYTRMFTMPRRDHFPHEWIPLVLNERGVVELGEIPTSSTYATN